MTPQPDTERISKDKIPSAIEALRGLDAKELPDVPAREAIRLMRRQIERVLKLGYTYDEVSSVLAGLDIHISGSRLKYLLVEVRKSTRTRSKKKADYVEGSFQAGTDESVEPSDGDDLKNGLEKSLPPLTQPQPQGKSQTQPHQKTQGKSQTQGKPELLAFQQPQSPVQPQSETLAETPTVDVVDDDYQPMVLRRR